MSVAVKLNRILDPESKYTGMAAVKDRCVFVRDKGYKKGGGLAQDVINMYEEYSGDTVAIPLAIALQIVAGLKLDSVTPTIPPGLTRQPKPEQKEILEMLFEHLVKNHTAMLDCDPGMGKTFMSLLAAIAFDMPTACVCNKVDNCKQWANDLLEINPDLASSICVMGSISDKSTQFTATPTNAKFLMVRAGLLDKAPLEILGRYKFIILDETHLLATTAQLKGIMRFFRAAYVVGCSGTPEKPDGRHEAIQYILGDESIVARRDRIIDFAFFNLNVFTSEKDYENLLRGGGKKITTMGPDGQMIETESNAALAEYGRMELSIAYNSVTNNRIAIIAMCLIRIQGHKLLIMCKTTLQCESIIASLQSWGVSATLYTGKNKKYNGFAEAIVGTTQVTLTAFDQASSGVEFDRRFTAAILCQSLKQDGNLWQGIGRIMRAPPEAKPVFVWLQYPMKTYDKHTETMLAAVTARKLTIRDHKFIVPKNIYDACFKEVKEIEIIRTTPIDEGVTPHVCFPLPPPQA